MRGMADESWMDASQPQDDRGLAVRFEVLPKQNALKTKAEGRPIFDDVEFIHIRVPGDKDNTVHRPVSDKDKRRFARAYAHWQSTKSNDEAVTGTPLGQWPQVSRSQVEELAYFGVRTVEQLASVSDGNLKNIGPMLALRQKAKDWLKTASDAAPLVHMQEELAARDEEIATLKAQFAELAAESKKARKAKEA